MRNLFKKHILLSCIFLMAAHGSWSQSIVNIGYDCTGSGGAKLIVSPATGITSYSWKKAGTSEVVATTRETTQPSGSYTVTYVKNGVTSTTGITIVSAGIVPTAPVISPGSVATPVCGSGTQVLTSTTVPNYTWKRDGTTISGTDNSITARGSDVSSPGIYSYTVSTQNATTGCSATSNVVALKMSPTLATPTVSAANGNTLICGSSTQTLTASGGGASYVWKRGSTNLENTVSSLTVAGTDATGTFSYTAALANSAGCPLVFSPTGISLTLSPAVATPSILTAPTTNPVCGTATQILTASSGGSSYAWKRSGTVINGSTNTITVTGDDVISGNTYNYTVSTQNAAGCVSVESAPFALKVSPKPTTPTISPATFTPNIICGSDRKTLTATSGGTIYTWKRSGVPVTGSTTNTLDVVGTDVINGGTYIYTVSLTNSVGCNSDDSPTGVSLTLSPAVPTPSILTSPTTNPVCGTATQILTASSGGTTYLWKRSGTLITGATNTITVTGNDVLIGNTYNYTVSTQNAAGCVSVESAPFALKVSPKPTTPTISPATFTPNIICGSDSKTLTATGGGTSYTWKRSGVAVTGSTTNTLDVLGTDIITGGTYIYTVSLTNSVGCISDDSPTGATLQLFPSIPATPTITANGVVTFCEGGSVTLNYSRGVSTDLKVWSRTSGADTTTTNVDGITVRSTNTFRVITKDVNGCLSLPSIAFLVTVNLKPSPPIIDKGTANAICELDSITLTSNNKGTGAYLWNTGKTTSSITVKNAGSYSLSFTDANSCTSLPSSPFVLTINPLPAKPTITSIRQSQFCYGDFTTLKAASTTTGTTFEWDYQNSTGNQIDISGSSKKTVDEIIKVSVRAVSAFSNSTISLVCKSKESSDFTTITVYPLPITPNITANGPIIFCPDSTVSLTSTDSPNGFYKWINTKNSSEFSDKKVVLIDTTSKFFSATPLGKVGKFYVRTISDKGCLSDTSKNVIVTVRNAPLKAVINPSPISATVCLGGKVTLKALFSNGNITRYSWRDETTKQEVSTEQEVSVIATGIFSVKVRDVFGCFAENSDPLRVNISPLPTKPSLTVVRPKIFCDEDSTTIQSSLPSTTPNGRNMYAWMVDGQTVLESSNRLFYWKKAGSISVALTDSNGCKALLISDTIRTTVNPLPTSPSITARGAIPFCADKNVTLSASGGNGVTFKWSTGATTTNITTNVESNVTVQSVNGFGCLSKPSQVIQVRVNPLPTTPNLTANGETTFCNGSRVRIVSSSPFQAFWWRSTTDSVGKGEDLTSIFASKTGNYFVKVQDDNGCISLPSTTINVNAKPNPTPTAIKQIGTFSLDAQGVGDENGYIWRYNDFIKPELTTKIIKAKQDGDYKVQASITYTGLPVNGGKLVCYSNTSTALKYVQDLSFNGFSVFPNPTANGEINVEVAEDLIGSTISIYNLYGQLISEYKVNKFNSLEKIQLPNYEGNSFVVKISSDGFDRTRRVTIFK